VISLKRYSVSFWCVFGVEDSVMYSLCFSEFFYQQGSICFTCTMATAARESENMREKQRCRSSAQGGAGGAPGSGAEVPLQPMEKTMVRQAVPLQPMEVHGGADIHLQPMEGTPCWSR